MMNNTLTREQLQMNDNKKQQFMLTNEDIAIMLGIDPKELYMASLGRPVPVEVYDAIMEWISE